MSLVPSAPASKRLKLESSPSPSIEELEEKTANSSIDSLDQDHCSICLQSLVDRTVIPTCAHEFCFECITIWSEQSRKCPLCSQVIGEYLIHHIRSTHDYQKYYLPPARTSPAPQRPSADTRVRALQSRRRERRWGRRERQERDEADQLDRAIARRRWIYEHDLYAKHVASNAFTRYRPYPTPAQFSASPDLISRMTTFLRRELQVWANLDVEFLTTFTISLMKSIDIRSESAVKLLAEFLDMDALYVEGGRHVNAEHFAHEIYSYLRSPYRDLNVYDSVVQYDTPPDVPPPHHPQRVTRWREASSPHSSSPDIELISSRHVSRSRSPVRRRENRRSHSGHEISRHTQNRSAERSYNRTRRSRTRSGSPTSYHHEHGRSPTSMHGHPKRPRDDGEPNEYMRQEKGKGKNKYQHSHSPLNNATRSQNPLAGPSSTSDIVENDHRSEQPTSKYRPEENTPPKVGDELTVGSSSAGILQAEAPMPLDGDSTISMLDARSHNETPSESIDAPRNQPSGTARAPRNRTLAQSVQAHLSHNSPNLRSSALRRRPSRNDRISTDPTSQIDTQEPLSCSLNPGANDRPSLLTRLSDHGQASGPQRDSHSHESHDLTTITAAVQTFTDPSLLPHSNVDDVENKRKLTAPEIMARARARLTKFKEEQSGATSPSPSTTADRSKDLEKFIVSSRAICVQDDDAVSQPLCPSTTVHEGVGCHSSVLQDATDGTTLRPPSMSRATRSTLLNRLTEEKRLVQNQVSPSSASSSSPLNNDEQIGHCQDDSTVADMEARLRTRAQLHARLAVVKGSVIAHLNTQKSLRGGSNGSNGDAKSGSREEALRVKLRERRK